MLQKCDFFEIMINALFPSLSIVTTYMCSNKTMKTKQFLTYAHIVELCYYYVTRKWGLLLSEWYVSLFTQTNSQHYLIENNINARLYYLFYCNLISSYTFMCLMSMFLPAWDVQLTMWHTQHIQSWVNAVIYLVYVLWKWEACEVCVRAWGVGGENYTIVSDVLYTSHTMCYPTSLLSIWTVNIYIYG